MIVKFIIYESGEDMEEKERTYIVLKMIEAGVPLEKEALELGEEDFNERMEEIFDDRLVENIIFTRSGNRLLGVNTQGVRLTRRGKDFIFLKESGRM